MAERITSAGHVATQLRIEAVGHRSTAWCELWRRLFAAIEADFAADAAMESADAPPPLPSARPLAAEDDGGATC